MSEPSKADHAGATERPWRAEICRMFDGSEVFGFRITSDYRVPNLPDHMQMAGITGANVYEHSAFTACFKPQEIEANAHLIVTAVNSFSAAEQMAGALERAKVDLQASKIVIESYKNDSAYGIAQTLTILESALTSWRKATGGAE